MTTSLQRYQELVKQNNMNAGWFDDERSFGDEIALIHSEVSEALEAFRDHEFRDYTHDGYEYRNQGPCPKSGCACKPEGVGSEFADILIRLLDSCERHKINLDFEMERKIAYNKTRSYKHGNKKL